MDEFATGISDVSSFVYPAFLRTEIWLGIERNIV